MRIILLNYIEIVSNSFLAILDDSNNYTIDEDRNLIIDLNKSIINQLKFYVDSNIKDQQFFGYKTILLNTCRPFDNWRKEKRGASLRISQYSLTDKKIIINKQKLEYQLNKLWGELKKDKKDIIFINDKEIDLFDLKLIIKRILGNKNVQINRNQYYILKDGNLEYLHDTNIPTYLINQVESKLRLKQLII